MKRFGIFRKFKDGSRAFVTTSDDESSAKNTALLLKEETGLDHLVFNLKTKIKAFDTGLYDRHLKKWNAMIGRKSGAKVSLKTG